MIDDLHFEGFARTYPEDVERYDPTGSVTMSSLDKKSAGVVASNNEGVLDGENSIEGKGAGLALDDFRSSRMAFHGNRCFHLLRFPGNSNGSKANP